MNSKTFIDPGKLSHSLQLQRPLEVPDGCGGLSLNWETVVSVWAMVVPIKDEQQLVADQRNETTTHLITIRFRDDVASGWRFVLNGRPLTVLAVHDPDERGCFLVARTGEEGR